MSSGRFKGPAAYLGLLFIDIVKFDAQYEVHYK